MLLTAWLARREIHLCVQDRTTALSRPRPTLTACSAPLSLFPRGILGPLCPACALPAWLGDYQTPEMVEDAASQAGEPCTASLTFPIWNPLTALCVSSGCCHTTPQAGGTPNGCWCSHSRGGWEPEVQVPAEAGPGEPLPGLQTEPCHCLPRPTELWSLPLLIGTLIPSCSLHTPLNSIASQRPPHCGVRAPTYISERTHAPRLLHPVSSCLGRYAHLLSALAPRAVCRKHLGI